MREGTEKQTQIFDDEFCGVFTLQLFSCVLRFTTVPKDSRYVMRLFGDNIG